MFLLYLLALVVMSGFPEGLVQAQDAGLDEAISVCSDIVYTGYVSRRKIVRVDSRMLSSKEQMHLRKLIEDAKFFELPSEITSPPINLCCDRGIPMFQISVQTGKRSHTVSINTESVVPSDTIKPLLQWLEVQAVPPGSNYGACRIF